VRFISFEHPPHLPKRWNKVYTGRVAGLGMQATPQLRAAYFRTHNSWKVLKGWLASASGEKCWYCEAKSLRSPFDVDHFRPKLGVTVDGNKFADNFGYYWIAYEWWNFRLSCQRCNRPEKDARGRLRGKSNEFPLKDEATRCIVVAGPLVTEEPRLLDPCVKEDCGLLAQGIDGVVKPSAEEGSWEFVRAQYTIETLGLNEWNAPEERRNRWQSLLALISALGNAANPDAIAVVSRHLSSSHEYSSFLRSAIGGHRDKEWISDLL
jgi:hypothetical protein